MRPAGRSAGVTECRTGKVAGLKWLGFCTELLGCSFVLCCWGFLGQLGLPEVVVVSCCTAGLWTLFQAAGLQFHIVMLELPGMAGASCCTPAQELLLQALELQCTKKPQLYEDL